MGSLTDRLEALEEAAATRRSRVEFTGTPEEATRIYWAAMRSVQPDLGAVSPYAGLSEAQAMDRYLEVIGGGAGRVPKGRG